MVEIAKSKYDVESLLSVFEARILSNVTISAPFWEGITPKHLLKAFEIKKDGIKEIEGGDFRNNQVSSGYDLITDFDQIQEVTLDLKFNNSKPVNNHPVGTILPLRTAKYSTTPLEVKLQPIQSVLRFHTRLGHLYSNVYDQLFFQLMFNYEVLQETVENLMINHPIYGLMHSLRDPNMFIFEKDSPNPVLLDKMISKVWKGADFFLMHPETLKMFHKNANKSGLRLKSKFIKDFDARFTIWRNIPILTTDKIYLNYEGADKSQADFKSASYDIKDLTAGETLTSILLCRIGEDKQGIIKLFPKNLKSSPLFPGLDIEYMGINDQAIASYLLTTYSSVTILSPDSLCRADVLI